MAQKWYEKATVQSAIVNAIPNIAIATIAILSIVVTCNYSKKQISQNQTQFNSQMIRDSLQSIQEDSVTKKQMALTKLQLEVINKQYYNDSINKIRELLIANKEYYLFKKQNQELDLVTKENIYIDNISFISYKTNYQTDNLDSIFGFKPDIIYQENKNTIDEFKLLHRLTFYNWESDKEFTTATNIFTLYEAKDFLLKQKTLSGFEIMKKIRLLIVIANNTKFPIKILKSSTVTINSKDPNDSTSNQKPQLIGPTNAIYPSQKNGFEIKMYFPIKDNLTSEIDFVLNLRYSTIYGSMEKNIKFIFSPEDKIFLLEN